MSVLLMRNKNAKRHISYLIKTKMPFLLSCSNYTIKVNETELKTSYVATMQSKRTFAAFAKLKSDLKNKPIPIIDRETLVYFQHNFRESVYADQVVNIDLKSAYATILYNDGLLSEATFLYLTKLKKQERLASVGMLASKKKVFTFRSGEPVDCEESVNELSNFFFYAVQRTYEIMVELKKICGNNYLFTWVDGIYFFPAPDISERCIEYLKSVKLNYSCDLLTEFDVNVFSRKVSLTFRKEGTLKQFNLPSVETEFRKVVFDAILSINKNKHNEKSKIKISR